MDSNASCVLKFFIKSYGCQMNVYDSQRIADIFSASGFEQVSCLHDANIVVLNTCFIREKAEEKLFSDLGRIKVFKEAAASKGIVYKIVVVGCVAQSRGSDIFARANYVDAVIGPQQIDKISEIINSISSCSGSTSKSGNLFVNFVGQEKFKNLPVNFFNREKSDFITIQEGCNNFCTYCVVPHTRGPEFSRCVDDIIKEAEILVNSGTVEITLLGQNVNSYHGTNSDGKSVNLAYLLDKLSEIVDLKRIRYTTSHPKDVNSDLLAVHRSNKKVMPFIHLPIQSGSDSILRAMRRGYDSCEYLECINTFREIRPDMAFSSDFIVGFPGETENDFLKTMELVRHVKFSQGYSFKYSPRPNTKASVMDNQVPESVKKERLFELQKLLLEQQVDYNKSFIGKILEVLPTKCGRQNGQLSGRSQYFQAVCFHGDEQLIGKIVHVKIIDALPHSLFGIVV